MVRKILQSLATVAFVALSALTVSGAPLILFSESFQSGLGANWTNLGPAQLSVDPLNAPNTAVNFSALSGGTNLLTSKTFNVNYTRITVEFDYLGQQLKSGVGTQTGGYFMMNGVWMFGAGTYAAAFADLANLTPGVWHHISQTFRPSDFFSGPTGYIALEQWNLAPNAAGGAWFDNLLVTVNDVPEPGTIALGLSGLGLLLLGAYRRKKA